MTPPIVLLTDFGLADHYAATMKAVIMTTAGEASFVDLTHSIPPQNVPAAAYQLLASYRYHPAGTIFLCVVDPGVGSDRKLIYAEAGGWRFLAPDNGLLSWVFRVEPPSLLVDVSAPAGLPAPASRTFHGRDILAPVAGMLVQGRDARELGPELTGYVRLPFPDVEKRGALWRGAVIAVDGFGNLVTNFRSDEISPLAQHSKAWFTLGAYPATVRRLSATYAAVEPGKLLAVEGSAGFVEISVRNGNAADMTGLRVGDEITVNFHT